MGLNAGAFGFLVVNGQTLLHMSEWSISYETETEDVPSFGLKTAESLVGISSWTADASGPCDFSSNSGQRLLYQAVTNKELVQFVFGLKRELTATDLTNATYFQGNCYITNFETSQDVEGKAEISISLTGSGDLTLFPKTATLDDPVIFSPKLDDTTPTVVTSLKPIISGTAEPNATLTLTNATGEPTETFATTTLNADERNFVIDKDKYSKALTQSATLALKLTQTVPNGGTSSISFKLNTQNATEPK